MTQTTIVCTGCDKPVERKLAANYVVEYTNARTTTIYASKVVGHYCGSCVRFFTAPWKLPRRPRRRDGMVPCADCKKEIDPTVATYRWVRFIRKSSTQAYKIHRSRRTHAYCYTCMTEHADKIFFDDDD